MRQLGIVVVLIVVGASGALWLMGLGREVQEPPLKTEMLTDPSPESLLGRSPSGSPSAREAVPEPDTSMGVAPSAPTPADYAKLKVLDDVLATRNDNDPRLDLAFRDLTDGAKQLFRQRYGALEREKLNERGTVVFLLGRSLNSPQDVQFLQKVAVETPCKSLGNCAKAAPEGDPHGEIGVAITLAYPQVVALKSFEAYLRRPDRSAELSQRAVQAIRAAQESPNPTVARTAMEILRRVGS